MKLKDSFTIYNLADEYMLIPVGESMASFGGTVVLNEVSAFILRQMQNVHKTKEELVAAMLENYNVEADVAAKDIEEVIHSLTEMGVLE